MHAATTTQQQAEHMHETCRDTDFLLCSRIYTEELSPFVYTYFVTCKQIGSATADYHNIFLHAQNQSRQRYTRFLGNRRWIRAATIATHGNMWLVFSELFTTISRCLGQVARATLGSYPCREPLWIRPDADKLWGHV
jgi:hypothetical protein